MFSPTGAIALDRGVLGGQPQMHRRHSIHCQRAIGMFGPQVCGSSIVRMSAANPEVRENKRRFDGSKRKARHAGFRETAMEEVGWRHVGSPGHETTCQGCRRERESPVFSCGVTTAHAVDIKLQGGIPFARTHQGGKLVPDQGLEG
jgi:hypothetical protein